MLIHNYDHISLLVLRVILMHGLYGLCKIHLSRLLDKQVMKAIYASSTDIILIAISVTLVISYAH
jgi:hypothetical protein